MDKQRMNLQFSSAISEITAVNSSFDKGIMRIFYIGQNRNNSFISRDALEKSEDTLDYCPIVVNYNVEDNTFGGHDIELVHTDGGLRMINATHPVGVVPQGARHWFETISDESGDHEYFCSEVLLWKRQPAYQKILEDGITAQSMEITVNAGRLDDGVYIIDDFEFTALTLLNGEDDIPCFESAGLQVFSADEFKQQYSAMMEEFKQSFTDIQQQFAVSDNLAKGGIQDLEEKMELVKEFNINVESLEFNLEDFTVEELREKFAAMQAAEQQEEFALTAMQLTEEMRRELSIPQIETDCGTYNRYWYMDHSDSEVYFEDCEDWNIYGAPYSMNGDHVVIDYAKCKRKKCAYVDFDEGDQVFSFAPIVAAVMENMEHKFDTERTASEQKYNELNAETEQLRQYKTDRIAADRAAAENAVFERFGDQLDGIAEFAALRENCSEMTIEDIEDKCFAILGRQKAVFTVNPQAAPKLPVEHREVPSAEPYGGLFEKYGKK